MEATTTVKRFMNDEAPNYHEAFGVRSTFDDQRGEFSACHPHSDLKEALQNCAQTWSINCDLETCTWEDVFDEMQAAEDEYHRELGGNILTAGLKLVFSIAKQQADMRNKILAAFRTIVDII
ncbi:hypothetical protein BJX66DRAFT_339730 [Aspergillus keveii]|uniref:Uncharacterized protein n=1 Tax=Aspergillus keveii TaxID=714993 RepID=A0ABR4G0K7_9EURO